MKYDTWLGACAGEFITRNCKLILTGPFYRWILSKRLYSIEMIGRSREFGSWLLQNLVERGWPRGLLPSASPPTVTKEEPTSSPIRSHMVLLTTTHAPTVTISFPPTFFPTSSHVVPIRAVPFLWRKNNTFSAFLNWHTCERLVVGGVDLWD